MTYDNWKTTNRDDERLGHEPQFLPEDGSRMLLETIQQAASPRVRLRLSDYSEVTGSIVGMGPQIGEVKVLWDDTDEVTIIGRYRLEMLTVDDEAK